VKKHPSIRPSTCKRLPRRLVLERGEGAGSCLQQPGRAANAWEQHQRHMGWEQGPGSKPPRFSQLLPIAAAVNLSWQSSPGAGFSAF